MPRGVAVVSRLRSQATVLSQVQVAHLTHGKTCAAVTCREPLRSGRIFCANHWFFLPEWLRTAIITTFRDAEWDAHQEAVRRAADHIDAAFVDAQAAGQTGLVSAIGPDGERLRYAGRGL
jgi:hypothetical protein